MKKTLKSITFGIAAIMASFLPCISTHAESKTATVTASIAESLSLTLSADSMDFNLETNDLYTDFINVIGRTNSWLENISSGEIVDCLFSTSFLISDLFINSP